MNQSDSNMFSNGLELANLCATSDLLHIACSAISETHQNNPNLAVYVKSSQNPIDGKIIVFATSPTCTVHHLQGEGIDLVSSTSPVLGNKFDFLGTKANPSFSINKAASELFASNYDQLSRLKEEINIFNPLIITGNSLGGSLASLFTLWLLDTIYSKSPKRGETPKRPICITFGGHLVGDYRFQRAILERPMWMSCFLHVVFNQDPILKLFISLGSSSALVEEPLGREAPSPQPYKSTPAYKPFGTFLFCSESGCACFDQPESILKLMKVAMSLDNVRNEDIKLLSINDYGRILEHLKNKAFCGGISELGECNINPLRAGITLQVAAIGVIKTQQQRMNSDTNDLISEIEKNLKEFIKRKRNVLDPGKKLNDIKISMTYLEWYKKVTRDQGGYYDSYKNARSRSREEKQSKEEIVKHQRFLIQYWTNMVEEADKMPQREGVSFRTRWLYAGTNYRRMVEPLDIADYYKRGNKQYIEHGRSTHYKLLEKWMNDEKPEEGNSTNATERRKACSLTEDSCFWAHVEEAIISLNLLKDGKSNQKNMEELSKNLVNFEVYVMRAISKYSVSPEIFLKESSFMQWWRDYEKIGAPKNSQLIDFMRNRYHEYA